MSSRVDQRSILYRVPFNPYGVPLWSGRKYLDFFQFDPGDAAVNEIWLGHESAEQVEPGSHLTIGTFSDNHPGFRGGQSVIYVAKETSLKAISASLPDEGAAPRPSDLHSRIVEFADRQASSIDDWATIDINVSNEACVCSYWEFADVFVGVIRPPQASSPISVMARNVDLGRLKVDTLSDTADYGFEHHKGVSRNEIGRLSMPLPSAEYHPDFAQILE